MTQKEKFMINIGIMMLAYAYGASRYSMAAYYFGAVALIYAVFCHSFNRLAVNLPLILMMTGLQCAVIRLSGLHTLVPETGYLALCNTAFAVLWSESSFKALHSPMNIYLIIMAGYLIGDLILPDGAVQAFADSGSAQLHHLILYTLCAFLPMAAGYFLKILFRGYVMKLEVTPRRIRKTESMTGFWQRG